MNQRTLSAFCLAAALAAGGCGDGASPPTRPSVTTTTAPPPSPFETRTLITVYLDAAASASWSQGVTREPEPIETLLGIDELVEGTTVLNNEVGRVELQAAIDRMLEGFADEDFVEVFDETKENLARFLNDADEDGWSIDGRHGVGRDWPHDADGNDPDGWTAQIVVIVERN